MYDDEMDMDQLGSMYTHYPPLRPPRLNHSTSVRNAVSPHFDTPHAHSSASVWSPTPFDGAGVNSTKSGAIPWSPAPFDRPSSNFARSDAWSSNAFSKTSDQRLVDNNLSPNQMPKKSSSSLTDRCSPRCKTGLVGFVIGLLAVSIAIAVVLVLWLKQ